MCVTAQRKRKLVSNVSASGATPRPAGGLAFAELQCSHLHCTATVCKPGAWITRKYLSEEWSRQGMSQPPAACLPAWAWRGRHQHSAVVTN